MLFLLIPPPLGLLPQTGLLPILALGILGGLAFVLLLNDRRGRKATSVPPSSFPRRMLLADSTSWLY